MNNPLRIRKKRLANFWEPVYNPEAKSPVGEFGWDASGVQTVADMLCRSAKLKGLMEDRSQTRWPINSIIFSGCDFEGDFGHVVFKGCTFANCDFGSSNWKGAKFSKCKFQKSSLTMCTFEQSQFIDCEWSEIGISGTETNFFDTSITNPLDFTRAAFTTLDPEILSQKGTDPAYQKMRLEETRTKVSRSILVNNERSGDDVAYYKSIEAYLRQATASKVARCVYNLKKGNKVFGNTISVLIYFAEYCLLRVSGLVNGWGASIARPALVGVAIGLVFMFWYKHFNIAPNFKMAAMKSFDVTLLFGYTKHAEKSEIAFEQISYAANAALGLWWYSIFVPTIINRISRVR